MTGGMATDLAARKMGGRTRGLTTRSSANAGHFLQEDAGEELAGYIVDFLGG